MNTVVSSERRLRVFIADDHASMVKAIERVMGKDFQVVGTASDGALATSEILSLQPDVVIMDVSMPGMSGIQACEELKKQGSRAKILFVSAANDPAIRLVAMKSGGDGFLSKTELFSELKPAIFAIVDGIE